MRLRLLCSSILILSAVSMAHDLVHAYQCGPICGPPMVPVCGPPVVPLGPCCQPSPLFPPAPPIAAPIIVSPEPTPHEAYYPQASLAAPPPRPYLHAPGQPTAVPPLPPRPRRAKLSTYSPSGFMASPRQVHSGLPGR